MPFMSKLPRRPLEEAVSGYLGRRWRASSARDMSAFAYHPCAILSDGSFAVFAKVSRAPGAEVQFEVEQAQLRYLAQHAGVLIPTPIGVVATAEGTLFIMEALDAVERGPGQWRQIGRTLARIHCVKSDAFGLHMDSFFGPFIQDNTPSKDWATFYAGRRLRPHLRLAVDSGNLPPAIASQVQSVIERLPQLCGPPVTPALVHGDAQQNNFISTAAGVYVIDPALYYGHPEIDLAFVDYFQPVPGEVFDGYRQLMPIDPGFPERRDLWRISGYLAAVAAEGSPYLKLLGDSLRPYL
jgi:fructosamine-3-kinase